MANVIQIKRRVNGASGPPLDADGALGELALNFPSAAGSPDSPEIWAHDGATWRQVQTGGATGGLNFIGSMDVVQPPTGAALTATSGDIVLHNGAAGVVNPAWGAPAASQDVDPGDMLIYDGTSWHVVQSVVDTSVFLPLDGGTMTQDAQIVWPVAGTPGTVILNGGSAESALIDNVTLDMGTY